MLIHSAQRFYISKLYKKCYLTPTYVFFIALTVIILQRLEEMLKNPMIFNILRVNIKIRNGTQVKKVPVIQRKLVILP